MSQKRSIGFAKATRYLAYGMLIKRFEDALRLYRFGLVEWRVTYIALYCWWLMIGLWDESARPCEDRRRDILLLARLKGIRDASRICVACLWKFERSWHFRCHPFESRFFLMVFRSALTQTPLTCVRALASVQLQIRYSIIPYRSTPLIVLLPSSLDFPDHHLNAARFCRFSTGTTCSVQSSSHIYQLHVVTTQALVFSSCLRGTESSVCPKTNP